MSAPRLSPARALDTGRELDALIAERVLGWQRYRAATYPPQSERAAAQCWHRPGIDAPCSLPAFSTDIVAAWQIVEKMRELRWDFDVRHFGTYTATFYARRNSAVCESSDGDTAPLAICRAALDAVTPPEPRDDGADV